MGLFQRMFSGTPDLREQLKATYTDSFQQMGMRPDQARQIAETLLQQAEQRSREQGTDKYPPRFGDLLIDKQDRDEPARKFIGELRAEGVRDEDIRWWWNMHDLERCMLAENDDLSRFTLFNKELDEGHSEDEAGANVRKHFPIFGAPSAETAGSGDDRPLPFELKDRINRFLENAANQQHLRSNALKFSSMNAYIRDRIRAGVL